MRWLAVFALMIGFVSTAFGGEAKVAVPDAAKLKEAETLIKDIFKDDYAKRGAEEKKALGAKLLQQGSETKDDPASQYVLLKEAAANAAAGGDAETAAKALDALGQNFEVDAGALKAEAFAKIIPATADAAKALTQAYLKAIDEAVAADNYDGAVKLAAAAEGVSRKTQDMPLVTQVGARTKEVRALQADFAKVKTAQATLKEKPDDPEANLAVGKFLCFTKGDWEKGLPLLAKGSDVKLKEAADNDAAQQNETNGLVATADMWWSAGMGLSGKQKDGCLQRALDLYRRAAPQLSGLNRTRIAKTVDAILGKQATAQDGNVALLESGGAVTGPAKNANALLDGIITGYDGESGFATSTQLPCEWIIALPKVYLLRELRILLWNGDTRFFNYAVETSLSGIDYKLVIDKSKGEHRSWQTVPLDGTAVKYIRLKGLDCSFKNPANFGFQVVELEAYCNPPAKKK